MNKRIKLPLAVALALGSVNALALGLGPIQIKSGLNQPLVAEIAVTGGVDETAGLNVALASAEDFVRVGLSRTRLTTPLEFSVVPGSKGGMVIRVTTQDPVKDPFLDFLLEVNWAKGKLLREYTVLLDPPVMAPAKGAAKPAAVKEAASTASTKPIETAPAKPAKPTKAAPAESAPAAPAKAAPRTAQSGEYGPVNSGEALYDIASATRPDDSITVNQMMLALLRSNPNAFYENNINSLKRGAILRIPSSEEIKAAASAAAAAAEVKAQVESWRAGAGVAKPTVVADTGSKPAPATKPVASTAPAATATAAAKPGDKLALVPPKAGSGSQAGGEKTGSSTTGSSGDGAAKVELARTKEALASREQEASELKSRVKELEDLKTKNDRLLSLKDSELAELQKKLKELQDKASKPAPTATTSTTAPTVTATPPATTATSTASTPSSSSSTPAKPADKTGLTKEDIWGSAATTDSTKPTTPAATSTPSTTSTATSGTTSPTATSSATSTPTTAPSTTPSATTTSPSTTPSTTSSTTPSTSSSTTPSTTTSTTPAATTGTSASSATATQPAATTTAEPPKPTSSTTPAKPSTPAKVQPLPPPAPEEPWYKKTWLLAAAGAGLLGLVLLGLMNFLRRPKAAAMPNVGGEPPALDGMQDEEHDLLDRLAMHPDDTSTHLELVSLYYARQDAEKFEDAAQAMYAHLGDTDSAEWEQIKAMGQELAPNNPLFSDQGMGSHHDFGSHPTPTRHQPALDDDVFADVPSMAPPASRPMSAPPAAPAPVEDAFDFDLTDHSVAAPPPPAAKPAPVEDFTLNMPAMDFDKELAAAAARVEAPKPAPAPAPAPAAPKIEDDFAIGGDDATGTKLDLAKAYLDMGDPEGARSMLEEVLTEGNANQKAEASRLLKDIR